MERDVTNPESQRQDSRLRGNDSNTDGNGDNTGRSGNEPRLGADNKTRVQVRYGEVDRMGLLYHVNYYEYFEWARSDWIRNFWRPYKDIEDEGYALVVIEGHIHYHSPAYYDDRLEVEMDVMDWGRSRIRFSYTIRREGESAPLCTGSTLHCFVNRDGKPIRLPDELRRLLKEAFSV